MTAHHWYWVAREDELSEASAISPVFDAQEEAEAYLSNEWQSLLDAGTEEALLVCDGQAVYGPMSLREA